MVHGCKSEHHPRCLRGQQMVKNMLETKLGDVSRRRGQSPESDIDVLAERDLPNNPLDRQWIAGHTVNVIPQFQIR